MFGGLEIKGASDKKEEKQPERQSGSSFSFMTGPSIPSPAESAAPPSAFSFMGSSVQSIPVEHPSPAGASGFSFLSNPEPPSPAAAAPEPTNSGFSFLSTPTLVADRPPSFMMSSSDEGGGGIAGAGVTFGGAGVAQRKNIKRRSRAPKVGTGAAIPTSGSFGSPGGGASTSTSTSIGAVGGGGDAGGEQPVLTRDAAEDALRRAEEFLQQKQQEQSKLVSVAPEDTASNVSLKSPTSIYSPDVDDELVEAQRAAEEAQARLAREAVKDAHPASQKSAFSWFGGLRSKGTNEGSERSGSIGGVMAGTSSRSSESSLMIPTPDASLHTGPETQAERILREQEEIKRAMAERHMMKMTKHEFDVDPAKTVWDRPPVTEATPTWGKPASELAATSQVSVPSWGVKAVAPPPPSPRQLMDIILQQFASDVRRAMNKVGELRQQRNMLLEERFVALAKERLAAQQIVQTETQQMEAAEQEDFELADRLQVVLEGHNRERAECTAILDNIGKALAQLDEQTPRVVNGVTKCFESVASDLEDFKSKQKHADDPSDIMARFAVTARQLSGENERLKGELKHLERDESLVKMERKELDDAIADQTAELEKLREESREKLTAVEREMDDLREQLRLKEIEAQQLKMKMLAQDADISKVLVKFNRQITRVQKKEMSVRENHKEWTNESNAYHRLKEAHEAEVAAHSEALLQRNSILDEIDANISVASTFQDIISQAVTFEHIREEDEEVDGKLAQIQADLVKCEAAVSEAAQLAKVAEATLVSFDGESRRLQEKLPKLEEEKSKAAAKRDFKTAGRASKEIKEFSARLQELEDKLIGEAKIRHKEAKASLEKVQKELEREQATANEKEKESGRVAMEKIATRIKALLHTKKKVCGKASPYSVKGVGGLVLKGQIDALKLEGQSLGHKFGGWEAIYGDIDESEEGGDEIEEAKPTTVAHHDEDIKEAEVEISSRSSGEVILENVMKARELNKKLAQVEADIDGAAEQEDFEKAAELDEILQDIKNKLEELDLTDAEADLVLSEGDVPAINSEGDSAGVEGTEGPGKLSVTVGAEEMDEVTAEQSTDSADNVVEGVDHDDENDVLEPAQSGISACEEESDGEDEKQDEHGEQTEEE